MVRLWRNGLGLGLLLAVLTWAAAPGAIQGHVVDNSGASVRGATVTIRLAAGGASRTASTDVQGKFAFTALANGRYKVTVTHVGFANYATTVTVGGSAPAVIEAKLNLQVQVQTVMVRSGAVKGATVAPSQQQVFNVPQSIRVLDREQINALSPVSGSAQILAVAPGANVTGFGSTGSTKSSITLNGVQQGWTGFGGYTTAGDVGISFDGIPVSDGATGLWQSNMFPQSALINSTAVTYGPGDPDTRWNNNVGGSVEFTPLQPSNKTHGSISQTFGTYGQVNTAFSFDTGMGQGWSAVFAGGYGQGDNFRQSPDGFQNPNSDYAFYGKAIKSFGAGDISFGGYYSKAAAYRPQVIPTTPVAGVTLDGTPGGSLYSQANCGFYCAVPQSAYSKHDTNLMALFWSKFNVSLDPNTSLQNSVWYERINRLHNRTADAYSPGAQQLEWNNPFTKSYADRLSLQRVFPYNTVTTGVAYMRTLYNSRANFFNPTDGGSTGGAVNAGGKGRSSYFNQDQYSWFIQDRIQPGVKWLTLTPGIRYFHNSIAYSDGYLQDMTLAPGTVFATHCVLNGTETYTNYHLDASGNEVPNANAFVDQGSSCASRAGQGGYEPSIDVSIRPKSWLNLYGGFQESLRTPALGGGGGMFQGVDPASYTLARAEYSQAGVKVHFVRVGSINNLLLGVAYFHLLFKNQELDITTGNGDSIYATASSRYNGVNWYLDADPTSNLHLFVNSTFERTLYSNWNQGGTDFTGRAVPYVPNTLLNLGAYYTIPVTENVVVQPRIWYQFTGSQTVFDNVAGAPSTVSMPTFGTLNLGANIPISHFNVRITAMNVTNKKYNMYEWISAGGYLGGTPGYRLAYPGSPFSAFVALSYSF